MNVKGILVEGSDGHHYLIGIGARTGGAQAERPTIWRVTGAHLESLEETRTASATIREQLGLNADLQAGKTHDQHVKCAAVEAVNAFLAKFFAGARW